MPRLARLDAPGVIHHVIIRGIERRRIFCDSKDHADMIERMHGHFYPTMPIFYLDQGMQAFQH
jgi:hypothetical protein